MVLPHVSQHVGVEFTFGQIAPQNEEEISTPARKIQGRLLGTIPSLLGCMHLTRRNHLYCAPHLPSRTSISAELTTGEHAEADGQSDPDAGELVAGAPDLRCHNSPDSGSAVPSMGSECEGFWPTLPGLPCSLPHDPEWRLVAPHL